MQWCMVLNLKHTMISFEKNTQSSTQIHVALFLHLRFFTYCWDLNYSLSSLLLHIHHHSMTTFISNEVSDSVPRQQLICSGGGRNHRPESGERDKNPAIFWAGKKGFMLVGPVSIPLPFIFFLLGQKQKRNSESMSTFSTWDSKYTYDPKHTVKATPEFVKTKKYIFFNGSVTDLKSTEQLDYWRQNWRQKALNPKHAVTEGGSSEGLAKYLQGRNSEFNDVLVLQTVTDHNRPSSMY